uniref:C2H2-type domain-containing protein n=1 Tax=Rhodnius prolixus TaxID=13249 RepID=T1HQ27_RHOPR
MVNNGKQIHWLRGSSLRCEFCGHKYKYKKGLNQHLKYECGKDPMFQCDFCPHKTKQKVNLKRF